MYAKFVPIIVLLGVPAAISSLVLTSCSHGGSVLDEAAAKTAATDTKAGGTNKSLAQTYRMIDGVDCDVRVKVLRQYVSGNISAEGVTLVCDGQPIKLIDSKITANWVETSDFGKVMVKQLPPLLAVFVTPDQNTKFKSFLAHKADLPSASFFGDIARVNSLLGAKVDVNARDSYGNTALITACSGKRLEIVRALVAAGANVNAKGVFGTTALLISLEGTSPKDLEMVQVLLAAKADVNARDRSGTTALMEAANHGERDVVSALLASGANAKAKDEDGKTALMVALKRGNDDVVRLLRSAVSDGK